MRCKDGPIATQTVDCVSSSVDDHLLNTDIRDVATQVTLLCSFKEVEYTVQMSLFSSVLQVSLMLGKLIECPPSEITLIFEGEVISRHPMFSLGELILSKHEAVSPDECIKLLVSRQPSIPAWIRLTAIFLCTTSLKPITFRMHTSSPVANVKKQLRELLRCPVACLSIYAADGAVLPDAILLRDLGAAAAGRVYCRVHAAEPTMLQPGVSTSVRDQIQRANSTWCRDALAAGCKRPRDDRSGGGNDSGGGRRPGGLFDALKPGFLSSRQPAPPPKDAARPPPPDGEQQPPDFLRPVPSAGSAAGDASHAVGPPPRRAVQAACSDAAAAPRVPEAGSDGPAAAAAAAISAAARRAAATRGIPDVLRAGRRPPPGGAESGPGCSSRTQ